MSAGRDRHGLPMYAQIIGESERISKLVEGGKRSNGKHLITPERAEAMARAASMMDVPALPREPILGLGYEPSGCQINAQDAQQLSAVLMAGFAAVQARLQALHDQIASLHQAVSQPSAAATLPAMADAPAPLPAVGEPAPYTHCAAPLVPSAGAASPQIGLLPGLGFLRDPSLRTPGG